MPGAHIMHLILTRGSIVWLCPSTASPSVKHFNIYDKLDTLQQNDKHYLFFENATTAFERAETLKVIAHNQRIYKSN
jgi:hypothetical protein